ncbi:hypothetical protein [Clostridium folliculivorans]|uniref:Uncharacterized protein n=1 Tax=Clostridium folliculivorans TaxID=2886038 RepID=A0A9W5XZB9_9CLOT|nr:hypothetical protein [Clostridium folliculivorans]GKU23690.1 hypothetical protein CFOLD11_05160 [Clostridium folliculivorans]GKU29806.1 hypothetical protein CFB3_19130 [Clostridium folliculivorans]
MELVLYTTPKSEMKKFVNRYKRKLHNNSRINEKELYEYGVDHVVKLQVTKNKSILAEKEN